MDPQNQNVAPSLIPPKPEFPEPLKTNDNHWITILSLALFILLSLGAVAFLYYQNQQLKSLLASYQTPAPSPTPFATTDPTANWKTYTNTKYNYSLKYPADWDNQSYKNDQLINLDPVSEWNNHGEVYIAPISIIANKSAVLYSETFKGSASIINQKQITINGKAATKFLIKSDSDLIGPGNQVEEIVFTESIKEPVIQFFSKVNDTEKIVIFDQILSTFKFTQ